MRLLLVGLALCATIPAHALEPSAELSSFAYMAVHSPTGKPFDFAPPGPSMELRDEPPPRQRPASLTNEVGELDASQFSKTDLCDTAASAAAENKLPVRFFANLIQQESGFKPHLVSPAGAQGIAQFMPAVAAEQGLHNPFDPIQALKVSAKFVANLVERFGNLGLAAAAYNAGSRRVSDWLNGRAKLPVETRNYVRSITGRPAENWMRVFAKGKQMQLPPRASCPTVETASPTALIAGHLPRPRQQNRLALNAIARPHPMHTQLTSNSSSKRAVVPGRRIKLAVLR
jgi:hypothetical protein